MDEIRSRIECVVQHIPGLQLESKLPAGGQKIVYKGSWRGRNVVLKLFHPDAQEQRALREVEALKRIESEFVAKLLHYETIDTGESLERFIIEEYILGEPASEYATPKSLLSIPIVLDVAKGLLQGLSEIHACNVVHRDIKPENIILSSEYSPTIIDFGIVRFLDRSTLTPEGSVFGPCTQCYAPFEVLYNKTEQIDARSDLYSLGITLFALLTGRLPYNIAGEEASRNAKRLRDVRPDVPEKLSFFVGWLHSYNRYERPASAIDALTFLREEVLGNA
jgi:serine/threonine protein kinase